MGHDAFALRIYNRDRAHCKTEKAIHQLIDKNISTLKLIYADEATNHGLTPFLNLFLGFISLRYLIKRKLLIKDA